MKPVVIHALSLFDLARAVLRVRSAAQEAISGTGAAKITIEPAQPGSIDEAAPRIRNTPAAGLAAARSIA